MAKIECWLDIICATDGAHVECTKESNVNLKHFPLLLG